MARVGSIIRGNTRGDSVVGIYGVGDDSVRFSARNASYTARRRMRTDVGGCRNVARRDLDVGGSIDER